MKNSLVPFKSHSLRYSNNAKAAASLKAIVFNIGSLSLALRIENVYKVLSQTPVYGSGLNRVGIAHVGDREVTVIDLNQQLFSSNTSAVAQANYLVVAQNTAGELFGIPVAVVPALRQLILSDMRVLPESYRHSDLLGIASHVCQILDKEATLTVFLLDVDRISEAR
ncbi:MAG: chemotaxis protein CheW [Chroococcidiopsidaceae cyanobacterium CP_BM_RX_35]|nr:chemotaxis protein CheW [Chroococcidiopsidaceae cyanobacterium CP_BM_RX_35]